MAYYKPCKNCAADKDTCLRRSEIAAAIAGHSVTVINFLCKERKSLFSAGQRVSFGWTAWEQGEFEDGEGQSLVFHGTVIAEKGLRFIVRVDDGPSACAEKTPARDTFKSDNLVIKVKPSDMRPLDEPERRLCPSCSAYEGEHSRCQGWDDPGFHSYWPDGCFRSPIAIQASE